MNQQIWTGLTLTLLTATLGTATAGYAQQTKTFDQGSEGSTPATQVGQVPATANRTSEQQAVQTTEVVKVGEFQSNSGTATQAGVIAKIFVYESAGRQAATLSVRSIPVLTFWGPGPSTADSTKPGESGERQKIGSRNQASQNTDPRTQINAASDANTAQNDPVARATAVAAKLNQMNLGNVDAGAIAVRWNAGCNCYSITANDKELVQINQTTTLPDTTRNLAEDALQATNRLRRLMGDAPPLREIAGKPPAAPAPLVARVSVGPIRFQIRGIASWYGPGFHGNRSASGEIYNQNALTAAHRSLPFGTKVQVTNLNNGRSVVVRINDRGPFIRGRVIDLSAAAARALGVMQTGVAPVQINVLANPRTVANEN
jgi:rare lipoprotein A